VGSWPRRRGRSRIGVSRIGAVAGSGDGGGSAQLGRREGRWARSGYRRVEHPTAAPSQQAPTVAAHPDGPDQQIGRAFDAPGNRAPNRPIRILYLAARRSTSFATTVTVCAWRRCSSSRTTMWSATRAAISDRPRHTVQATGTALDALRRGRRRAPDLIVLDLGCRTWTAPTRCGCCGALDAPVIIATARDDEAEIVRLLRAGADDYMVKPFSSAHLGARVATVLRRSGGPARPSRGDRGRRAAGATRASGRPTSTATPAADPQGIRPARLPRGPPRPGGVRRELLEEVWRTALDRRRPDDRRASVLAAPEAGRERAEPGSCTPCGGGSGSWSPD
jgi:CheY-like chemotaxis protein